MPPKTEADEERRLWLAIRQLEPLRPDVRVGHLRRRRVDPRPHRPGHRPDRRRDHADAGRPPDRGQPLGGRAAARHRVVRRGRRAQRAGPARRPARRPGRGVAGAPRGPAATPPSWSGWSSRRASSASAWPRSPRVTCGRRAAESDVEYFVRKCRAGADFAITQMFFYVEDYLRLRDEVAARGCDVPIIAGIMPIISVTGHRAGGAAVRRAVSAEDLAAELREHADDKPAVRKIGVEYAAADVRAAARRGRAGPALLHAERLAGDPGDLPAARPRRQPAAPAGAGRPRSGSAAPITA